MEHSREVWLAADASKFNRQAMVELGRLSEISRLFTDQAVKAPFGPMLEDSGVDCVVAQE
jgi:DeoR family glycerol-3-phosphate regulon repressor